MAVESDSSVTGTGYGLECWAGPSGASDCVRLLMFQGSPAPSRWPSSGAGTVGGAEVAGPAGRLVVFDGQIFMDGFVLVTRTATQTHIFTETFFR